MRSNNRSFLLRVFFIVPLSLVLISCGGGGGNGEDAEQDQEVPTDGVDGEVQVDPRPDEVTQDEGVQPDGEDPAADDAVAAEEVQEDPAEEDVVEEELPTVPPVDCGGVECTAAQECCFTGPSPWAETCVDIGACTGGVEECDAAADCPEGQVCCHRPPTDIGAACVDTCNQIYVCGDDTECPVTDPYCCPAMGDMFNVCGDNPTC